MDQYFIFSIGLLAQILFGSRMIFQWIRSEKANKVLSPSIFWKTSLFASAIFLIYGVLREDTVIIFGQFLSYFIYIRNLQLKRSWQKMHPAVRWAFGLLPFFTLWSLFMSGLFNFESVLMVVDLQNKLFLVGAIGQLLLNFRFIYQWYFAERTGVSELPLGFWVIGSLGAILVITYAIYRLDPVLLLGQVLSLLIYSRNIILHLRTHPPLPAP